MYIRDVLAGWHWLALIGLVIGLIAIASIHTNGMLSLSAENARYVAEYGTDKAGEIIEQGGSIFREITNQNPSGSSITTQIPTAPKSENIIPVQESQENFTQTIVVPESSIQICSRTDPNGCIIQGYAKLFNPVTGQPIKPYFYSYYITVDCAKVIEGFDYCQTDQILNRGVTEDAGSNDDGEEIGGKYFFRWRVQNDAFVGIKDSNGDYIQKGLYDVRVFTKSEIIADTGRYEEIWNDFQIDLRE